jgi:hypothetical protein
VTASGASIDAPIFSSSSRNGDVVEEMEELKSLIEYLERNLTTLVVSLSTRMAQEVIKRTWDEMLVVNEQLLVPPLYGQM